MDKEIRAMVEAVFVEECGKLGISDIISNKSAIVERLKSKILPYFLENGITITVLGLKGELTYLDENIQKEINSKFIAKSRQEAQAITNKTNEDEARSQQKVLNTQKSIMKDKIELEKLAVQKILAQAELEKGKNWRPTTITNGNSQMLLNVGGE